MHAEGKVNLGNSWSNGQSLMSFWIVSTRSYQQEIQLDEHGSGRTRYASWYGHQGPSVSTSFSRKQ